MSRLSSRQRSRTSRAARKRRHKRVRRKGVFGTPEQPRLNVYRSLNNTYAQIIDDTVGHTITSASTLERDLRDTVDDLEPVEAARFVGKTIAERAKDAGVERVVFDRGGYQYHGRIQAVAEGARDGGLEF